MKFTDLNLSESLLAGLRDVQFVEPTPVQEKSIPIVLSGKDLIATAQTGTGKTGAFVIPIMDQILKNKEKREGVKALILSPTRELAKQIDEEIFAIGYHTGLTSATVIGGSDFSEQVKAIKAGVDIIVATPGRLMDQNKVINIDFSNVDYFILDEADRMLDMGFLPDIRKIISWLPKERQTLLFSATMPNEIQSLAGGIMKNPEGVDIERSKPSKQVEQRAYTLLSEQKIPLVKKIFKELSWDSCIIFTSTKKGTDELHRLLRQEGIKAESIHGDRSQDERNRALSAFKNGKVPVIVATDVLARGIDIKEVSIIINYDVPNNTDDYIHRIGRTGRYDKSGIAITFVTRRDSKKFRDIERIKGNTLKHIKLPRNFGENSEFSWDNEFKKSSSKGKSGGERDTGKGDQKQRSSNKNTKSSGSHKQESSDHKGSKKQRPGGKKEDSKPDMDQRDKKQSSKKESAPDHKSKSDSGKAKKSAEAKEEKKTPEREPQVEDLKNVTLPPVVEKAVERNKRSRKPAKGVWGIIKSMIPKF
ncbi:DEAD/DEAH box helicase [Rhodohalobacter halophilus]|uniref:DEAD/DEAH box helicase n=1 Tax=Rhodohalobacter halophilus TaxID=1812810 RepID=UPI00083F91A4|nr:DEAD/DEAH box helicase [Rhodohalobacter halophilus]